jgi:hypothetical protein
LATASRFRSRAHKSVTIKVTAPDGTILYFVCALHPWMQGKIVVKWTNYHPSRTGGAASARSSGSSTEAVAKAPLPRLERSPLRGSADETGKGHTLRALREARELSEIARAVDAARKELEAAAPP